MPQQRRGGLVEDHELALARMDGEARRAEQALFQLVTEESGAVDYLARVQIAAAGMQQPFAAVEGAVQHFDVETGLGAMGQRLLQIGERRGPGVDQMLTGDPHRTEHIAGQLRLQRQDLVATDLADVIDTVAVGLLDDGRQARQILVAPCRHQGAGFQQRQVEARMDVAVFAIALLHAGQFDAAGRRVETGMEDRAVALAGTGEDVGAFSSRTTRAPSRAKRRAMAQPTTPAPITATSKIAVFVASGSVIVSACFFWYQFSF